ncbi:hypothetical protein DL766_001871 [Monosporascus sp. MC13-8B]|uniref:MARVEL domain-containing protein n=1 Tax=Monosporascus cannonballus TaxID=155416 RepID=A0ABY0H4R2_9PEZI|nr:hypothetical protein DL762_005875 [Monosporascus cannonballus]RYO87122.1 hypothetical protein DL763_006476 [Monosporascus cannonballus]RYP36631.1 hypothetical protein DL766_001871 [Monosporascus sp. MC13-8B]
MALFSYRLSRTLTTWKSKEEDGQVPMVEFIWEGVNIGFSLINCVLTLVSIAKFVSEVLTPSGMLFSCILSTVLALAILALDILVYVKHSDKQYSLIGLVIDSFLLFFTIIPLIYSIIAYRRVLDYDLYYLPGNVKPFGYDAAAEDTAYPSTVEAAEPYDPTNPKQNFSTRPRSLSALSANTVRLSFSSKRDSGSHTPQQPQQEQSAQPEIGRRPSYDHRRSTQFDEYVARRLSESGMSLKSSVERALSGEFGWEDGRSSGPRDSIVVTGAVASLQARPRGNSLGRQPSVEVSISNVSTPTRELSVNSGAAVPHSLVSVPEAHEEEEIHTRAAQGRSAGVGETHEPLLGSGPVSRNHSRSPPDCLRTGHVNRLEDVRLESRKTKDP